MLRKIMKRAHELAKKMIGDYSARMVLALRQAWKEAKQMTNKVTVSLNDKYRVELPVLEGTEKQIRWAEKIRKERLLGATEMLLARINAGKGNEKVFKKLEETISLFENSPKKASWWIEYRDTALMRLEGKI